jgi:hypothetical protein
VSAEWDETVRLGAFRLNRDGGETRMTDRVVDGSVLELLRAATLMLDGVRRLLLLRAVRLGEERTALENEEPEEGEALLASEIRCVVEDTLNPAVRRLEALLDEWAPPRFSLENAPEDDEAETPQEAAAVADAWRDHREGKSTVREAAAAVPPRSVDSQAPRSGETDPARRGSTRS